jgi:hypothetical protein
MPKSGMPNGSHNEKIRDEADRIATRRNDDNDDVNDDVDIDVEIVPRDDIDFCAVVALFFSCIVEMIWTDEHIVVSYYYYRTEEKSPDGDFSF